MEGEQIPSQIILCQTIDPKEEHITDREGDVFNLLLYVNDLDVLKSKVLEESRVGKYEFNHYEYGLVKYF